MKKVFLLLIIQIITNYMGAQINIPQLSPAAKVEQQIGLDNAIIKYGRPSLRGRKLLGQANIPYGKVWRMGANDVTSLELTGDMIFGGIVKNIPDQCFSIKNGTTARSAGE
jgi:hypothetical protein